VAKLVGIREFRQLPGNDRLAYVEDLLREHAEEAGFSPSSLKVIYSASLPDGSIAGVYEFGTIYIYASPVIEEPARALYILAHEIGHWKNMLIDFKGEAVDYWQASPVDKEPKAWLYGWEYAKSWGVSDLYLKGLEGDIASLEQRRAQRIWLAYREELLKELRKVLEQLRKEMG